MKEQEKRRPHNLYYIQLCTTGCCLSVCLSVFPTANCFEFDRRQTDIIQKNMFDIQYSKLH